MKKSTGTVYTFYSYKGGVGRSMALANVAVMLAKWGKKVLIIDWDLEAPGIERYFFGNQIKMSSSSNQKNGIVDIINTYIESKPLNWKDCIIRARIPKLEHDISIITAGKRTPDYLRKLRNINWAELFSNSDFGHYLEEMRNEWIDSYDFVLIDSRTGITDIGGICTIHLPDVLVLMFTTNEQSLDGVKEVMRLAQKQHQDLPFDRRYLLGVPIPSRDESRTEYEAAQHWKEKFSKYLDGLYRDWIPKDVDPSKILDLLRIPYVPYWSFGERLPVLEEGTNDPTSLGFSLEFLARTISSNLNWNEVLNSSQITSPTQHFNDEKEDVIMTESHLIKAEEYIKTRLEDQIMWYSKKSQVNQYRYKAITAIQLVCSLMIPFFATIGDMNSIIGDMYFSSNLNNIVISFLGLTVALSTGMITLNKYQENWINYRTTAEALKKEKYMFMTESPPYQYTDNSFSVFVSRVESLISRENTEWNNAFQTNVAKTKNT